MNQTSTTVAAAQVPCRSQGQVQIKLDSEAPVVAAAESVEHEEDKAPSGPGGGLSLDLIKHPCGRSVEITQNLLQVVRKMSGDIRGIRHLM